MTTKQNPNIHQRILAVMAEVDYIQKGDKKVNNMYRFVSHDQVTAVMHKQFVKHGIVCVPHVKTCTQNGNRTEVMLQVDFINPDDPNDSVFVTAVGYGIDSGDKGPGKAISYAFKYALLKLFCLETGDDPENEPEAKYEPPKKPNGHITKDQLKLITYELTDHPDILQNLLEGYGIGKLSDLPERNFVKCLERIKSIKRVKEINKSEKSS